MYFFPFVAAVYRLYSSVIVILIFFFNCNFNLIFKKLSNSNFILIFFLLCNYNFNLFDFVILILILVLCVEVKFAKHNKKKTKNCQSLKCSNLHTNKHAQKT